MLTRFRVRNFKCLGDVTLDGLGPFNVLIGPNDTGKSSVLQAMRLFSELASREVKPAFDTVGLDPKAALRHGAEQDTMEFSAHANIGDHQVEYSVAVTREGQVVRESLQGQGLPPDLCYRFPRDPKNWAPRSETLFHQCLREPVQYHDPRAAEIFRHMTHALKTVQYTLDPRALAKPSEPTKDAQEGPRLASNGEGLASVLEYLILVERAKFDRLEKQLHSMVDCVQELKVQPVSGRRQLAFRLSHAEEPVPASLVSDGLLLFLGYLALLCLPGKSPHTILIDEPENGIHPRRLKEIVGLLRTFCREQSVQVVLTTHSPCLLDWVEPGEVHILTRDDDLATRATRMSDVPDIDVLRKGYQLGELWFNDGEEDLIRGVK